MRAYGHYYLQISNQAIDPLGEAVSNVELFRDLARRFGFTKSASSETTDQTIDVALDSGALHKKDPWLKESIARRLESDPTFA